MAVVAAEEAALAACSVKVYHSQSEFPTLSSRSMAHTVPFSDSLAASTWGLVSSTALGSVVVSAIFSTVLDSKVTGMSVILKELRF